MSSIDQSRIQEVKRKMLDGMREEWHVRELNESKVTFNDNISLNWRSHVIEASMTVQSEAGTKLEKVVVKYLNPKTVEQVIHKEDKIEKLLLYFKREAGIWRKIGTHENIAEIIGIMESFNGSILPAIVSPYYPMLDLRHLVETKRDTPVQMRLRLMRDVANGLQHLHSRSPRVVHRDIKGNNILIKENGPKLVACISDFGSAKFMDQTGIDIASTTLISTIQWTPPEYIINGRPSYSNPTIYGDIWSFGCTFIEVLRGADPWDVDDDPTRRLMARKHPQRPEDVHIDEGIWSLILHCWEAEAEARMSAAAISSYMDMLC